MIETVTKFRTEDGQEFDTEQEAVAHEIALDFQEHYCNDPLIDSHGSDVSFDTFNDYLQHYKLTIIEYLTGENQPDREYQPGVKRWDKEAVERIAPIVVNGEVIYRPDDAWNAALSEVAGKFPFDKKVCETAEGMKIPRTSDPEAPRKAPPAIPPAAPMPPEAPKEI